MFKDIFNKIIQQVKGIHSIGIWGIDGLELDNFVYSNDNDINFELFGAEVTDIVKKIYSPKEKSNSFLLKLKYKNNTLVLYPINEEFFYMIFTNNNVIINKLEFYLDLFNNEIVKKIS